MGSNFILAQSLVVHRTPFQFLSAPSLLSFSLPPPIALGEHFPFGADCDEGTEREGNEQRIHPEEAEQWRQCRFSAPRPTPLRSYSFSGLDGSCPSCLIPHLSLFFLPLFVATASPLSHVIKR